MRIFTFIVGIAICLAIIVAGIIWIVGHNVVGGSALGLGVGGLIDVVYLFARKRPARIGAEGVPDDAITLVYRVSHLDSIDVIVCIIGLIVPIAVFAGIWHG